MARLSVVQPSSVGHIIYNDLELINRLHDKRTAIRNHIARWFSPRYGIVSLLKTLTLLPWGFFPGFNDLPHAPALPHGALSASLGSWPQELDASCRHRIRSLSDLSHWLVRYDMLASGAFAPRSMADCRLMTLTDDSLESICRDIEQQRWRMICLNDSEHISDFDRQCQRLCKAFERILPEKSSYEI